MAELGETADPVSLIPGSVSSVFALAAAWHARAARAESSLSAMRGVPLPARWTGKAADAFEGRLRNDGRNGENLQGSLSDAARALQAYAEVLAWGQSQALAAIETWESARINLPGGGGGQVGPTGAGVAASATNVVTSNIARQQRSVAASLLEAARAEVASAGDTAANALEAATVTIARNPISSTVSGSGAGGARVASNDPSDLEAAETILLLMTMPFMPAPDPSETNDWWTSLDPDVQQELIEQHPALVGNLEGVTYSDRDTANRLYLEDQIEAAEAAGDEEQVDALEDVQKALKDKEVERQLISLTNDQPPLAAISIGNLDEADSVTFAIPGINSSTGNGGMTGWARTADILRDEQLAVSPDSSPAVVAWMGYETPDMVTVGRLDIAEEGGRALDLALLGTTATVNSRLNVVGWSYGGTTAAEALSDGSAHVDAFVMIAPPGIDSDINSASDLNADEVYAGENDGTWWWGSSGAHSTYPTADSFGAVDLGTKGEPGLDPVTGHDAHRDDGGGYFDYGTESLRNIVFATIGQGDQVTGG